MVTSAVMAKDGYELSDSLTATVDGAEAIVLVINAGGVKGAYILLPYDPATGNRPDASAPTTHTVTFNSDGGSKVAAQSVDSGDKAAKPADPTKSGYTFKGWFLGETEYDFATAVTGNITLKAKWEEKQEATEPTEPTTPDSDPSTPQTDDNSKIFLWIALLFASGLCLAVTVFGKKRFSVK